MTAPTTPVPNRRLRSPRPLAIVAATAVILGGSYVLTAFRPVTPTPARSTPPVAAAALAGPTTIDAGATASGSLRQIDHSIEAWSKNLAVNPRDYLSATTLAVLYQGRGRLSYDLADHERALTAARTALGIEPTHAPARAIEAAILLTLHDFAGAFAAADALVRDDPSQLGALATRFDAELELGSITDARSDLERLAGTGGPAFLVRQARLASVTGDAAGALASAQRAVSAAADDEAGDLGFYAYAVGEYARLAGDAQVARQAYRQALDARNGDLGALIGLARIDAFEGNDVAAMAGLTRAIEIAPQPEALALLGDLQAAAEDRQATTSFDTVRFIERLGDIQSTTFDRQLLRFELDHSGASEAMLGRARASMEARPDWTGHDTLAWALYRLGRLDEAADEIAAARALGADDARLRFHDGAIATARGDRAAGAALLRSALDLGPALDPVERAEATTLFGS
jgi:tetratricopeptide (TPR) repeat protein